jgi:hypothetical protein
MISRVARDTLIDLSPYGVLARCIGSNRAEQNISLLTITVLYRLHFIA